MLGSQITHALAGGNEARTLLVRVSGAPDDALASAFAQVPWDLARLEGDLRTLRQRGIAVRIALVPSKAKAEEHATVPEGGAMVAPQSAPVRVLLVFAEPAGARPAGARIEREELLDTFFRDVLPHRDVEVDVLCHGVTRAQIWEHVRRSGGYHVVHWSGRALAGGLEIELEEGEEEAPVISGEELADLLSGSGTGEVTPALVLLSACRAGALGVARDWDAVRTAMGEPVPAAAEPTLDQALDVAGGTPEVALAMIAAGIPAVVATRHEVAPSYARRLARSLYRRLLASESGLSVDEALAGAQRELAGGSSADRSDKAAAGSAGGKEGGLARTSMPGSVGYGSGVVLAGSGEARSGQRTAVTQDAGARGVLAFSAVAESGRGPVTSSPLEAPASGRSRAAGEAWQADLMDQSAPILFGARPVTIVAEAHRSALADRSEPKPQPLLESGSKDLDPSPGFVGRGGELGLLARTWLMSGGVPLALVDGPAGIGKTSLAAEAIHLWHRRFGLVLAFQPLRGEVGMSVQAGPEGVPSASVAEGKPSRELEPLLRYVDRRLREESSAYRERCEQDPLARVYVPPGEGFSREERGARLIQNLADALRADRVLLVLDGLDGGASGQASEAVWWRLLAQLGPQLGEGDARLLVTCRRGPPAAELPGALRVSLGSLPLGHAAVLADRRSALREILARGTRERREGGGAVGQAERLARRLLEVSHGHPLVLLRFGDVAGMGRPVLEDALARLGALEGGLPAGSLPGGRGDAERAWALLEDVGACLVDLLLERLSLGARRLLWGMSLASEPVPAWMIEDLGSKLLPGEERPRAALAEICAAGLAVREEEQARGTVYEFHDLIAERVTVWMEQHPEERAEVSTEDLYRCFGERYTAAFRNALPMLQQGLLTTPPPGEDTRPRSSPVSSTDARTRPPSTPISESRPRAARRSRELCAELGRRSVRYLVRGRAFQALSAFGSAAFMGAGDASLVAEVVADLAAAADHGEGPTRWRARVSLADALRGARQVDASLPLYEQAASEAATDDHWADLGVILTKWATALAQDGRLDEARALFERGAEAKRRAGKPLAQVIAVELEALRIDVMQQGAVQALPEIERRVEVLRELWRQRPHDEEEPLGAEDVQLGGALVTGVDVARRASAALERWEACLALLDELEVLDRGLGAADLDLSRERFHRWTPLVRLGRMAEATEVIEGCLEGFRRARDTRGEVRALSALASVRAELGDLEGAAALEREALSARERFASAGERAIAHCRLASMLGRAGRPVDALDNVLAAVAYQLAAGQDASAELRALAIYALEAAALDAPAETAPDGPPTDAALQSGSRPLLPAVMPRLASLLERPSFASVRKFLSERGVSLEVLQVRIDDLFAHAAAGVERGQPPSFSLEEAG
ncbi:CHAT domain-containing protein [Chondromyces apiculatus]|uniref:CHAT domain-containing protein n=1 Tax=Chondromyces apiculatus TaxID=51 RepID=UPI0018CC72A7|nr:CHAT domain-containing protein [Chondromyces apiculatus]